MLYPNQMFPGQSDTISQSPPSYETVRKTFKTPNEVRTNTIETQTQTSDETPTQSQTQIVKSSNEVSQNVNS